MGRNEKHGVVSALHFPQGYGFIVAEDDPREIFFHAQSVVGAGFDNMTVGDDVTFRTIETQKGMRAVVVKRVGRK
jgi:cold shock CspA family protein